MGGSHLANHSQPGEVATHVSGPVSRLDRREVRLLGPAVAIGLTAVMLWILDELPLYVDGGSYLAIAEHWAAGDWSAAINAYWSPLLSMLLAPAVLVGIPAVVAASILSAATAGAAIAALQRLMRVCGVASDVSIIVALGACPFVVFATLDNLVPDLLMAALLVVFVADIVDGIPRPVRTGAIGGLAFLAKAYALPFMLAFCVLIGIGRLVLSRATGVRTSQPVYLLIASATMLLIVCFWSLVISIDEGQLMFSSAAEYNRKITAPGSPGNPYGWLGLIEPDHPAAFWGWEDPAKIPVPDVPDLSDAPGKATSTNGRLNRIWSNANQSFRAAALVAGSALAAALVFVWAAWSALVGWLRSRQLHLGKSETALLQLGLAAGLYTGGLLWLVVNARYLYFVMLILVAVAAVGVTAIGSLRSTSQRLVIMLAIVLALTTAARPAVALVRLDERVEAIHEIDEFLGTVDVEGRRVASYPVRLHLVGARCIENGCVYLGSPTVDGEVSVEAQLVAFGVDTFVVDDSSGVGVPAKAILVARSDSLRYSVYDVSALDALT